MRIISKFNDYYDSALAYGVDMETVYVRKADQYDLTNSPFREKIEKIYDVCPYVGEYRNVHIEMLLIGFCGKIYPVCQLNFDYFVPNHFTYNSSRRTMKRSMYSVDDVQNAWKVKMLNREMGGVVGTHKRRKRYYSSGRDFNAKNLNRFFQEHHGSDVLEGLFYEINSPIFIASSQSCRKRVRRDGKPPQIEINGSLRGYQFYRVTDPYSAFQEVEQYISGVLRRAEPIMATVSDASMLMKKGFHDYSFKTRPQT